MSHKTKKTLSQMTLNEKLLLLAGQDNWRTHPIDRLGIPAIKVTDGPNGARGEKFFGGPPSACLPVGVALAATWNPDLIEEIGGLLAEETKAKSAHVLLGPTVNIHRSPLAGRNFECYSEDPYLTGRIAIAYIKGLQEKGVGASIKHFAGNDSEFERLTISSEIRLRALHEIYLPPFKAAVKEANPWTIMAAYNKLNGTFATEHQYLLKDLLRDEWGFDGVIVSDWGAVHSTVPPVQATLDLEMPGPAVHLTVEALQAALQAGEITEVMIDNTVRRLLDLIEKTGVFENPAELPEGTLNKPEHRNLLRRTAVEGMVLLKNQDALLPLNPEKINSIAVIGPNAQTAQAQGGGSAGVTPYYTVSPLEGLTNFCGDSVEIRFEPGVIANKNLAVLDSARVQATATDSTLGLTAQYFPNSDFRGEPALTEVVDDLYMKWIGQTPGNIETSEYSVRLSGQFVAPEDGLYAFGLISVGPSRLFFNNELLLDNWTDQVSGELFFSFASAEVTGQIELTGGRVYPLTVEYAKTNAQPLGGLRIGCRLPQPANLMEQAVTLAAESDVALIFAGLNGDWESEGYDRVDMDLPGEQAELIQKVATVNKHTVVILNNGAPVNMTQWLAQVPAVLEAWYPGQECGNAIAEVLFGAASPDGRLPTTFPKRLEDNPAYINYPGENGQVHYGEDIFVGYRYYEKKKIAPLFSFGHGLSYTTFKYSDLTLSAAEISVDNSLRVSVDVTNTGTRPGQEVVQLYIRDVESRLVRPEKELKAFKKLTLEPGQTVTATFTVDKESLAYYDPAQSGWVTEPGTFIILAGSSSQNIRSRELFVVR